ncbi:MAG: Na+/H+ antiporter subunit E [Nitrospinota bacterium]|jgi:multicomponent Na+:H+ antiporter subunit E|nr:Na+/H+ antiporter subunit E [Nitrospinota bacterium]MDP6366245.1 Na+/H+ antiporter subunit E [Nitrospinota bacterium]MDP7168253.1 Na+/H+ antiporter subunit E [Nitrospinota bacterium]|tara:strand:+ start:136 stop:609 length:474 start_codon:yes stop_codon:yes gene_type:complete
MPLATLALSISVIWLLLKGDGSPGNFFVGLILAMILIYFLRRTYHQERSFRRVGDIAHFLINFTRELIVANIQVLKIALSPRINIRPGIIAFKTECKTPLGITLLANSITLTPGTLSVDISEDQTTIFIHTLDIENPDQVRDGIRRGLEEPVKGACE